MSRRRWTQAELDLLAATPPGQVRIPALARQLGRSRKSVSSQLVRLRQVIPTRLLTESEIATIHQLHAEGWWDAEIARRLGRERHTISDFRRRTGLPPNTNGPLHRQRTAEQTQQFCQALGVRNLGEMRSVAFRLYALDHGWPADLRPRAVQILELLHREGPKTRQQIAEGIGLRWNGSHKSLKGSVPGGTYLADLARRGLVVRLGRLAKGRGKGGSCNLYSLALDTFKQETADGHV